MSNKLDRIKGCLVGLAVGDALGVHHEFKQRKDVVPITDYTEGNPYDIPIGYWTDDTSMALCMAQSLVEKSSFDPMDIMKKFVKWQREGYMSSTDKCFDIGCTTRQALLLFEGTKGVYPYCGSENVMSAGNGSIMRLAPIPMFFHDDINSAIEFAGFSSMITHRYVECVDGCKFLSEILWKLINGYDQLNVSPDSILVHIDNLGSVFFKTENKFCTNIQTIVNGSLFHKTVDTIKGSGYVVDSLEASLYCFCKTKTFEDAVLMAVNLGDDADTTGAVTGQLAGAYYGYDAIPQHWKDKLRHHDMIVELAEKLANRAQ